MADRRRVDNRDLKKDPQVRREVLGEIGAEIAQTNSAATYRNPNRDQTRGDTDRSGRHVGEGRSRDNRVDGDEGLRPPHDQEG